MRTRLPKTKLGMFFLIVTLGVSTCVLFTFAPMLVVVLQPLLVLFKRLLGWLYEWAPLLLVVLLALAALGVIFFVRHVENPRTPHDSSLLDWLKRRNQRD